MNQNFTDYYESNLKLLKKHHPSIWKQFVKKPPEPAGSVYPTESGKPNLIVKNNNGVSISLHPGSDPEQESEEFLKKIPEDENGFVAMLGLGLGYGALKVFQKRPLLQYIALFELNPGIFLQALHYTNFSGLFDNPKLILRIGCDQSISEVLSPAFNTIRLETSRTLHHNPSFNLNGQGYADLKQELFDYINKLNVDGSTVKYFAETFLKNRLENVSTMHHHFLLEQLKGLLPQKPAILVAGGPSLNKNIHLLQQIQNKAVIIAVDTVLPSLLEQNIRPHFLTTIDPHSLTFEKFANIINEINHDIALVCSAGANSKTIKNFPNSQIFWTFSAKSTEMWINKLIGGNLTTIGANSVAHMNHIAASILGCDPLIFIGQDLAYPGTMTHAKGTVLHGASPSHSTPNNQNLVEVKGIDGSFLKTDRGLLSIKEHFETLIANSNRTHINATEGGAHIEGTKAMKLQDAIDKFCVDQDSIRPVLQKHYQNIQHINTDKLITEFKKLLKLAAEIPIKTNKADKINKAVITELKRGRQSIKSFSMLSPKLQKQIKKIDDLHLKLDNNYFLWEFLQEVTLEALKKSERRKHEISLLENNPDKYIEWLIKNLQRFLSINKVRRQTTKKLSELLINVIEFRQKETKYQKNIHNDIQRIKNTLELIRLYMGSKNYSLAAPLLDDLLETIPDDGELHYFKGCIESQWNANSKENQSFRTALKYDATLEKAIKAFTISLGEEFLSYAQYFKTFPGYENGIKYMVLKGLNYDHTNRLLIKELENILQQDLNSIASNIESGDIKASKHLINEWHQKAESQRHIFQNLSAETIGRLYFYHGRWLISQKIYQNAIKSLKTALKFQPKDKTIHSILIETLFITGDFSNAIEALEKAIKIDNEFAKYWEMVGDSLQSSEQYSDAILAFEKCFVHQPDNLNLLRKIADCYMETDQLEAAKTAYELLKKKMEAIDDGKHHGPEDLTSG